MADFFIGTHNPMQLFGALHIALTVIFAAAYAAVFVFRQRLREFGHFKEVRIAAATLLLLNMLVHYGSKLVYGVWSFEADLPLHLCFIANLFMIYILYSGNKGGLYRVVYFFTFIGPLPAMLLPDLDGSFDSYIFYQFVISHHVMLLISLYALCVLGYETGAKQLPKAFLCGNSVVGAVMLFNLKFGTNYIMMAGLPAQLYCVFPFLSALPPLVWLELAGICAMAVACVPIAVMEKQDCPRACRQSAGQ